MTFFYTVSMTKRIPQAGWALITGATGGLGRALADEAWRHGFSLFLTSTNLEALAEMAKGYAAGPDQKVAFFAADLSRTEGVDRLLEACRQHAATWALLVNNAGWGLAGALGEQDPDQVHNLLAVNIQALTRLTQGLLPALKSHSGRAWILNVASVGAWLPGPNLAAYYASKAYVLSLSLSLRQELKPWKIGVTALCPASLDTGFHRRAKTGGARLKIRHLWTTPAQAARVGFHALFCRKISVVPGFLNKIGLLFFKIIPMGWAAALLDRLQR